MDVEHQKGLDVQVVAVADQVKSLEWRERHAKYTASADTSILDAVNERILALLVDD